LDPVTSKGLPTPTDLAQVDAIADLIVAKHAALQ